MGKVIYEGGRAGLPGGYWVKDCDCKSKSAVRPSFDVKSSADGQSLIWTGSIALRCLDCEKPWKLIK